MRRAAINCRQTTGGDQHNWATAFRDGLRRHGWQADIVQAYEPADLFAMWGVRRQDSIERQKKHGGRVCILERGYVGDRFKYTSLSFGGGLNGRGEFRGPLDDPSRWEKLFAPLMKPWRGIRGGPALILGQVPGDMSVQGVNLPPLYAEWAKKLKSQGFDVAFRPHPKAPREWVDGVTTIPAGKDLNAVLTTVCMAVTYNSNSGVDAVLAGVPTVAMDRGSMAWPVTGHEIAMPPQPDRSAWAHNLAWKQYTKEEIASGYAWEMAGCPS